MARGRGGSRTGTPGTAYPNRTDLSANAGSPLPIQTAPSTEYGQAAASRASQQAVPLAPTPTAPPGPAAPAAPPPMGMLPGELPPLTAPSNRPDEPITHGMPMGPGAGPEVLPQAVTMPAMQTAASTLSQFAKSTNPALAYLASVAGGRV